MLKSSWDKNDTKYAQVILRMLEIGAVRVFHDPLVAGTCDIQEFSKTYEMVARAHDLGFGETALLHRNLLVHPAEKILRLHPLNHGEEYLRMPKVRALQPSA
jgi:hypothetical protein